ncbi:hypothetical protein ABZ369_32990 [Streptomyces sp. NPDC005918]|uniref:hypothetical protein n=1 Tax=Streptomyces sp. NPDC005918 TaxID=3155454 RepID=UPI0034063A7B
MKSMMKLKWATGASAVAGLLLAGQVAHAAPSVTDTGTRPTASGVRAGGSEEGNALKCTNYWTFKSPWGHTGKFKCGSHVLRADWDNNGTADEYFGIAPNRTIWHDWKNAGRWVEMPNAGRADDTLNIGHTGNGRYVRVKAGGHIWVSIFSGGKWHKWYMVE